MTRKTPTNQRNQPQPLVISYLRFSTPEQLKGDSKRRQTDLAAQWAEQNGLKISESLSDLGISAYRGANSTSGKLGEFLRLVEQGRVPKGTFLIVEELDRISRESPEESLPLFLSIIKAGIVVVTLNTGDRFERGAIDMGRLMIAVVKFCTAHDESLKKGRRHAENWRNKRAKASEKPLTSLVPSWLKMSGGKIVADPQRVKVVKRIFKMAREGQGAIHIAGVLNNSPLPVLPRSGAYTRKFILYTLRNRAVLGEYQPGQIQYDPETGVRRTIPAGDPVKGYFPQIISEGDFFAVQEGLRRRRSAGGPTSKFVHLFTGLLYSVDGSTLVITTKRKGSGRRYVPSSVLERRKDAVKMPLLPVSTFEQAFLWAFPSAREFVSGRKKHAPNHVEIDAALEQVHAAKQRRDDLQTAYLGGKVKAESVVTLLAKADEQVAELEKKLERLKGEAAYGFASNADQVAEMLALIERARTGMTTEERINVRSVVRQLVERIEVRCKADGFHYVAGCKVKTRAGRGFDFTFKAFYVDPRTKDKRGHWIAGKNGSDTQYRVGIIDGKKLVLLPFGEQGEISVHPLVE
jgi:DNA invertase Pin-like site-specific DNA recombinase